MRLPTLLTLILPLLPTATAITIQFSLPSPAPHLPATTISTLSSHTHHHTALISPSNTFTFQNLTTTTTTQPSSSYLFETISSTTTFPPLRVDISETTTGDTASANVQVWTTFRGNEWGNLGEVLTVTRDEETGVWSVMMKAGREKEFWTQRAGFSPLSILKNPLLLLGLLGAGLMFGMPYLMENMDPEVKEAFEQRQASGGSVTGQVNNLMAGGGFDAAAWLAGSTKKSEADEVVAQGKGEGVRR